MHRPPSWLVDLGNISHERPTLVIYFSNEPCRKRGGNTVLKLAVSYLYRPYCDGQMDQWLLYPLGAYTHRGKVGAGRPILRFSSVFKFCSINET